MYKIRQAAAEGILSLNSLQNLGHLPLPFFGYSSSCQDYIRTLCDSPAPANLVRRSFPELVIPTTNHQREEGLYSLRSPFDREDFFFSTAGGASFIRSRD